MKVWIINEHMSDVDPDRTFPVLNSIYLRRELALQEFNILVDRNDNFQKMRKELEEMYNHFKLETWNFGWSGEKSQEWFKQRDENTEEAFRILSRKYSLTVEEIKKDIFCMHNYELVEHDAKD